MKLVAWTGLVGELVRATPDSGWAGEPDLGEQGRMVVVGGDAQW